MNEHRWIIFGAVAAMALVMLLLATSCQMPLSTLAERAMSPESTIWAERATV